MAFALLERYALRAGLPLADHLEGLIQAAQDPAFRAAVLRQLRK